MELSMPKHLERIRAAAFDLDGTLIDTMADLASAVNLTLTMLDAPVLPEARIRSFVGSGIDQLVMRALSDSLGTRPPHEAQRSAALALFRRHYALGLFKRGAVFPGVVQTLESLAQKGVALCCITNKERAFTLPLLQQAGLARFFAFTLCADRPEERKPSPTMLLAACSRFGVTPAEMVYVGDSRIDIEAARAAGCPVVTVGYGYDADREATATQADRSIVSMTDLLTTGAVP